MEEKDESRKGPWTEQEDVQLVFYVNLFGDRRWDFIAKVSGLKRTGKSCRLRWVNYLHPGLKRDKMTPHEERLVLELHSKWGNRWSRIARKLPGRTDNEIKNYWRTHMRKTAQEKKKPTGSASPSSSSSSNSSSLSSTSNSHVIKTKERTFFDSGGLDAFSATPVSGGKKSSVVSEGNIKTYSMDEIWKDIEESCDLTCHTSASPTWDFCSPNDSMLWSMDEERSKTMMGSGEDYFNSFPFYNSI